MALSGQTSNAYFNNSHYWIYVTWTATQDVAGNFSTVTAKLYLNSDPSWNISASAKPSSITINGSTASASVDPDIPGGSAKLIQTSTVQVNHNADGTKSFTLSGTYNLTGINVSGDLGSATASGTFTLNTIPRASTLTSGQNWTAGGSTTFQINRASTSFTHDITVEVHNGTSYVSLFSVTDVATSYTWTPDDADMTSIFDYLNNDTTNYDQASRITLVTKSGTTTVGTNTYTGLVSSPSASTTTHSGNINMTDATVVVPITRAYTNLVHTLKFYVNNTLIHTSPVGQTTSYTWTISAGERTNMYNACPSTSTPPFTIEITTFYDSTTTDQQVRTATNKIGTATVVGGEPTFTTFTYSDTNSTITAITGNNQWIVQNKSTLVASIISGNQATPFQGATITKYIAEVNGESVTINSPFTFPLSFDFGTIDANANQNLKITVYDSRNLTKSVIVIVNVVAWSPPVINAGATRAGGFDNATTLTVNGTISKVTVAGVDKNGLIAASCTYRYRQVGGTFGASNTLDGGVVTLPNYTFSEPPFNLTNTLAYEIEVTVTDKFGATITSPLITVAAGTPIFFMDSALKSLGVGKFPTIANTLEIATSGKGLVTGGAGFRVGGDNTSAVISATGSTIFLRPTSDTDSTNEVQINSTLGMTATGKIATTIGGQAFDLKAGATNDHVYMGFYADSQAQTTRSGYFGYGSAGASQMTIANEMTNGGITLQTNGTGQVSLSGTRLFFNGTSSTNTPHVESVAGTGLYLHMSDSDYVRVATSVTAFYFGNVEGARISDTLFGTTGASKIVKLQSASSNVYLQGTNVNCTQPNTTTSWVQLNASGIGAGSRRATKENIVDSPTGALDKIKSTKVYDYHLKSELTEWEYFNDGVTPPMAIGQKDPSTVKKRKGLILEEAPTEIVTGDTVELYAMTSLLWQAVQELNEKLENKTNFLENKKQDKVV